MDLDLKRETSAFMLAGCGSALICSIPLAFAVGIGGALVCAIAGIAAAGVACAIRNRVAKNAQRSLQGHTQIQGVLDSSQLDQHAPDPRELIPFARHGKVVAAAISLTLCLVAGGIVGVVTRGAGISFNLGEAPKTSTTKKVTPSGSSASTTASESSDSQDWSETYKPDYEVIETWYPPEEEVPQNTVVEQEQPSGNASPVDPSASTAPAGEPTQNERPNDAPAPSAPSNEQPDATQTPTNSGTIDNASQNAQ